MHKFDIRTLKEEESFGAKLIKLFSLANVAYIGTLDVIIMHTFDKGTLKEEGSFGAKST